MEEHHMFVISKSTKFFYSIRFEVFLYECVRVCCQGLGLFYMRCENVVRCQEHNKNVNVSLVEGHKTHQSNSSWNGTRSDCSNSATSFAGEIEDFLLSKSKTLRPVRSCWAIHRFCCCCCFVLVCFICLFLFFLFFFGIRTM